MIAYSVTSSNFKRFWLGQTLSQFGTRIGIFGMPVIAVDLLHASSQEVGVLKASSAVCYFLIGLPAGAWVDRMLKRTTMTMAASVRCLAVLTIPVLWFTGDLRIETLYVVAVVVGLASVFFNVAYQSYVPVLVPQGDIASANARLEATSQLSAVGGPALAGLFMRVVSAPVVMLADACAHLGCLLCLAMTKDSERVSASGSRVKRRMLADITEGLRFVRDQPVIRRLAVSMGVSNFFAVMIETLIPIVILRTIGFDAFMLGIIMMCGAVGGVLGALLAPVARRRFSAGTVMAGGLITAALFTATTPVAAVASSHSIAVAGALLLIGEFGLIVGAMLYNVTQVSLRQTLCPRELLGRMNAFFRFIILGSIPFAALAAGWLGSTIGVVTTMWIGVIGTTLTVFPIVGIDKIIRADTGRLVEAAAGR